MGCAAFLFGAPHSVTTTRAEMDYQEVVAYALGYLREHRVVGEGVIRDLRTKSKQLPCTQWMLCFKGTIPQKTYTDIQMRYIEHSKHDHGFTCLNDKQVAAIGRYYADPFSV